MNAPNDNDPLDALLRQTQNKPIADAGFSLRVLAELPPTFRFSAYRNYRLLVVSLGAIAGFGVAIGHGIDLTSSSILTQMDPILSDLVTAANSPQTLVVLCIVLGLLVLSVSSDSPENEI